MIRTLTATLLLASSLARAHDEGHGPKLTDAPKQGGVLASVVLASQARLGPKAALVYKAELVRGEEGLVRMYLYDASLAPLRAAALSPKASAVLLTEKKGKTAKQPFSLEWDDAEGAYAGKLPKPARKPYNVDVTFDEGKRKLLAAFDGLD